MSEWTTKTGPIRATLPNGDVIEFVGADSELKLPPRMPPEALNSFVQFLGKTGPFAPTLPEPVVELPPGTVRVDVEMTDNETGEVISKFTVDTTPERLRAFIEEAS